MAVVLKIFFFFSSGSQYGAEPFRNFGKGA